MLGIDLAALSSAELKRLLDASRAKGEPQMTAELLREMAHRGVRGVEVRPMAWPPQAPAAVDAEPGPAPAALVAALAATLVAGSAAAGWWLTRPAPAAPPARTSEAILPVEAPPVPGAAAAALAAPAAVEPASSPPAARAAAPHHRHAKTGAHRAHHGHGHARPEPRHGLLHRLTDWLRPTPR
jgi:hypothetical protein